MAAGTDGAHVEICRDRACTNQVTTYDVTGTSRGVQKLPPGVLFWRAYGRNGQGVGQTPSPTWQLVVGTAGSLPGSWGTTLDVNGDGLADILIGAPQVNAGAGAVYLYLGRAAGVQPTATVVLSAPAGTNGFGQAVASAGDVNGDGYSDLIVGATSEAYLYLGGAAGLSTSPAATLSTPGAAVASAGDVNADGYADVMVGASLYLGSASGLPASPTLTVPSPPQSKIGQMTPELEGFGYSVSSAGDVNGDGFGDVIIGSEGTTADGNTSARTYFYLGGVAGLSNSPTLTIAGGNAMAARLSSAAIAGDVNGDGLADIVIGSFAPDAKDGEAFVYLDDGTGLSASSTKLSGPLLYSDFGRSVAGAGDVNGDGFDDVIVGAPTFGADGNDGQVNLYFGELGGPSASSSVSLSAPATGTNFGFVVAGAGDVNGDGFADVIVGAPGPTGGSGLTYLYLGSSTGPPASPSVTFQASTAAGYFGSALASVGSENPRGWCPAPWRPWQRTELLAPILSHRHLTDSASFLVNSQSLDSLLRLNFESDFSDSYVLQVSIAGAKQRPWTRPIVQVGSSGSAERARVIR